VVRTRLNPRKISESFVVRSSPEHCARGDSLRCGTHFLRIAGAFTSAWLFLPAALTFAGCRSPAPLTPQQLEGKHLYDVRCAHCHELNDLALKKVPPSLRSVFDHPSLPSGAPATDQNVERTILSGKGTMPSFAGRFTHEQMAALLAYLHAGLR
jgi:mono/diheme cytochrome c family protein